MSSSSATRNKINKDQMSLMKMAKSVPLSNDIQDFKIRLNEIVRGYDPKIKVLYQEVIHSRIKQPRDDERVHCPVIIIFSESAMKQQIKGILWKHFEMNEAALKTFLSFWGTYSSLSSLRFEDTNFKDDDILVLANFLNENQNVTDLNINGNTYSKSFKCLIRETRLQYLSMKFCSITDNDLEEFMEPLQNPYKNPLLHLNLSNNNIGDGGARVLGKVLRVNRILISVNVAANGITDKGAIEVLKSLQMFSLEQDEISIRRKIHYQYYMIKYEEISANIATTMGGGTVASSHSSTKLKTKSKSVKLKNRRFSKSAISSSTLSFTPRDISMHSTQDPHIILPLADAVDLKHTLDFDSAYHPFVNDITVDGFKFQCRGNLVLAHLNLSFNKLTADILEDIQEVFKYQSAYRSADDGLKSIGVYGNHLRTEENEFGGQKENPEMFSKRMSRSGSIVSVKSRDMRRKTKAQKSL